MIREISAHCRADCVNSSPPPISRKCQGFGGIWANSGKIGKFRENSVELSGIQWGFVWRLVMNSVGIPGGFRGNAGFRENLAFGVVSGDLGVKRLLRKQPHCCSCSNYLKPGSTSTEHSHPHTHTPNHLECPGPGITLAFCGPKWPVWELPFPPANRLPPKV